MPFVYACDFQTRQLAMSALGHVGDDVVDPTRSTVKLFLQAAMDVGVLDQLPMMSDLHLDGGCAEGADDGRRDDICSQGLVRTPNPHVC